MCTYLISSLYIDLYNCSYIKKEFESRLTCRIEFQLRAFKQVKLLLRELRGTFLAVN